MLDAASNYVGDSVYPELIRGYNRVNASSQRIQFFAGCKMSSRKALISLSLLLLTTIFAGAQDQSSQPQNSQSPTTSAPASTTKDQTSSTAQTPAAQPSSTQSPATQPSSAPAPTPPGTSEPSTAEDPSDSAKDANAPANPPVVQEPDDSKVKHDGGKDDVGHGESFFCATYHRRRKGQGDRRTSTGGPRA